MLKEIFRAGDDVHAATAAEVFDIDRDEVDIGQRSKAKMVNFGIVYGLTGFGLADRLNIPREEGEEFVARYLERFPAVRAFREEIVERAQEDGYVTTADGSPAPDPGAALGQSEHPPARGAARRQHRDPGNRGGHHQGGDDPLPPGALREAGIEHPPRPPDPRRAALRGPSGRDGRGEGDRRARDVRRAIELDPPLEVEIGVGKDWLDAK